MMVKGDLRSVTGSLPSFPIILVRGATLCHLSMSPHGVMGSTKEDQTLWTLGFQILTNLICSCAVVSSMTKGNMGREGWFSSGFILRAVRAGAEKCPMGQPDAGSPSAAPLFKWPSSQSTVA